jgi:transcriptional regulator with XRE-family HTH domain
MTDKRLMRELGQRLRKLRKELGFLQGEFARLLGIGKTSYAKYENGESFPRVPFLQGIGAAYDVSLDWLLLQKGAMFRKEKGGSGQGSPEEIWELLDHMEHIPLLRYGVLQYFHQFKHDNKDLVESSMKDDE